MKIIQKIIQEKTGLKIDQPDSSGGTTTTGNVVRRAFWKIQILLNAFYQL